MANAHSKVASDCISITVVYAAPHKAEIRVLSLPKGSKVHDALEASQLLPLYFQEIDQKGDINFRKAAIAAGIKVGVFGRSVEPTVVLKPGDQVEIYRPLALDPKQMRFLKVKRKKQQLRQKKD